MKILHVTPAFYPATVYGGPIFSTYALCNSLAALPDTDLRVLTCDMAGYSLGLRVDVPTFPMRYQPGYNVYFTRRIIMPDISPGMLPRIWSMTRWADVVHLTGTYSFPTLPVLLACKLRGKPLVWSPRGALRASHEWKDARRPVLKRIWERLCIWLKPRKCVLHVTAEAERQASVARLPSFDAEIISNAVDLPIDLPSRHWKPGGILRLMFMGRLDPIKGIEVLLHVLPKLKMPAVLDIFGTGESAYVEALKKLAADLGITERVHFRGHVEGDAKRDAYLNTDIFVFPSYSENFGMVVAEALAHATPAVVSRGAPWPGIDQQGCGRWVENDPEIFATAISELYHADLDEMGRAGRKWMQEVYSWSARARAMKALFRKLTEA